MDRQRTENRLSAATLELLRCPNCGAAVRTSGTTMRCEGPATHVFPVVDGVPILINDSVSVFSVAEIIRKTPTYFPRDSRLTRLARSCVPSISMNLSSRANYRVLREHLAGRGPARVLVLGGSIAGAGMEALSDPNFEIVETDITLGGRTALVCDAHDIPFADAAFECVIAQAVLEHVADPHRCVEEIFRVLKPAGWVYAETPFMQQVHGGAYDFTRFTYLGHRRLFRKFDQVAAGAAGGPGMALAWSYRYFLLSFVSRPLLRNMVKLVTNLTSFPLKWIDPLVADRAPALDAASGYYFLGRKSDRILSDRELIQMYPGAGNTPQASDEC